MAGGARGAPPARTDPEGTDPGGEAPPAPSGPGTRADAVRALARSAGRRLGRLYRSQGARQVRDVLRLPPAYLRWTLIHLYRWWRRSLQARVVAATLALGLVVVWAVGALLNHQIQTGLVQERTKAAVDEATRLTQQALSLMSASTMGRDDVAQQPDSVDAGVQIIEDMVTQLQGPVDSTGHSVILLRASSDGRGTHRYRAGDGLDPEDIPEVMRHKVRNANPRGSQYVQILRLGQRDASHPGATRPVVLVGAEVWVEVVGWCELYIAFDLTREERVLHLMQRSLSAGGFLLVLLVAAVAAVVTRQVVAPVRHAAQTAEELASGRLDRRMHVRGEDDIARLGRAFNEMAESLAQQIHRLEELSRVQRRFVSDVSHELRTPLTTIRMASEMIYEARRSFEPSLSRSAELLTDQLDRFEALLTDLLEISRFDAGAAVLEADAEELREVVARVMEGLRPLAERHGSEVRLIPVTAESTAEVDARRVERVVRNLLANALEHGEGRPIDLLVAADEDAVAVVVRDRGVGLEPTALRMVFDRFWRGDPARARTTGGTGLGLAIALEDAHLHGGRLEVWGAPGEGASFRLTLPRRAAGTVQSSPLPLVPPDVLDGDIADGFDRSVPLRSAPLPTSLPETDVIRPDLLGLPTVPPRAGRSSDGLAETGGV